MQNADSEQLNRLGLQLAQAGQINEAEQVFQLLAGTGLASFEALKSYAFLLANSGKLTLAENWIGQAIDLNPSDAVCHNVLSYCLIELGRNDDAVAAARKATLLAPRYAEAHSNLGIALNRLGLNLEAFKASHAALQLQPNDAANLLNHGNVLRDLGRSDEALSLAEKACAIAPNLAQAQYNRGNLLKEAGRPAEAIEAFDQAVALDPNHSSAHWNRALCNLLVGEYEAGWQGYEWRWKDPVARPIVRLFDCPLWLGETDIAGKSIIVHCEQGFGDALQFIRYAAIAAECGAQVHVQAFAPLVRLFGAIPGLKSVTSFGEALPTADFHCPLMSLPLALWRIHPAIPAQTPYLAPDVERRAQWAQHLAPFKKRRIGLAFSGAVAHRRDAERSIPLDQFLTALPTGPDYFVLQTELRDGDTEQLQTRPDITLLAAGVRDFCDTAAICLEMDLIVSVDTSVAHLAGALDRPLIVLIPYDPDWRWGLRTETTPWYPSARVLRQTMRADWTNALQALRERLEGKEACDHEAWGAEP